MICVEYAEGTAQEYPESIIGHRRQVAKGLLS